VLFSTVGGGGGTGTATLSHLVSSSQFVLRSETAGGHEWYVGGSERARIDSSGRFLVGTSSARSTGSIRLFQVEGTSATTTGASITRNSADEFGPFLNLAKSRSASNGGNTVVVSGDALGVLGFYGADGNDIDSLAASIAASVDGTPGADDMPGRLTFSTTADGASSPTERMRISNGGNVFFNTTNSSPAVNSVSGTTIGAGGLTEISQSSNTVLRINRFGALPTGTVVDFRNAGTVVGTISTAASSTAYNTSSDYRLKENVVPLTGAIDRLQQIPVHRFNFIADPDTVVDGFIAHEAQEVVPECVTGTKDEVDDDGNPVYQGIDQSKLVPLLTAALQEAIAEIASLKDRVAALETP
jgi:hypothetical protein